MKQAFLIMAHNNIQQLEILISLLDNKKFDFFIHIDKKSNVDLDKLKEISKKSKIYVYSEYDIKWASFTQTLCELFLIEKALANDKYEYFHLISGLDLPLISSDKIYNFFHNSKKEFVHFESKKISDTKKEFVKFYYPLLEFKNFKNSKILKGINLILITIQKIFRVDRTKKYSFLFYTGANWFSITNAFASYLITKKRAIINIYKHSRSSDEIFLQTELMNSKFKDNLYYSEFDNNYISCMRKIDWNRGKPYTWKKDDFEELINSGFVFARKFDWNTDNSIILQIKDYIERGGKK